MVWLRDGRLRDRSEPGECDRAAHGDLADVATFLGRSGSWRVIVDLVCVAMAGGLFTVPLYALIQHESEPSHRSRVIAANNIINAVAMSAGALGAGALSGRLTMGELFGLCGP